MKQYSSCLKFTKGFGASVLNLAIFSACTTKPVVYSPTKQEGQWEAKAQIKDLKDDSTNTVSLGVMAIKDKAMRIEITGTLGIQVASLLMKGEKILVLVHPQKKAMFGEANEAALEGVIKTPLNPQWFYGVFFDAPIEGWQCQGSPISQCLGPHGESVVWSEREGEKKRITIKSPQFQMQILVKSYLTKVQDSERAFSLVIPESYRKVKIN